MLLTPGTEADLILFAAAVQVALAALPGPIIVHRDAGSRGGRDFAGVAGRCGEQVGCIHAHTPDGSPHLREIGLLVISAGEQDPNVTDALLADVLRWASMSGATAVTRWVVDWPEHREEYERQGFGLVGKWRLAGTGDRRVEEWQIRAALRPDPQFWQGELLGALGDVAPRKPGWRYVLRWAGLGLMFFVVEFAVVDCVHSEAFGRVVGLSQNFFLSPNCPDETDDILIEPSSPLAKAVCIVALNGPHPGAPGEGGGILRAGDCEECAARRRTSSGSCTPGLPLLARPQRSRTPPWGVM